VLFHQIVSKRVFFLSSFLTGFISVLPSVVRMTGLLSEWNGCCVYGIQAYVDVLIDVYFINTS
jgi:hypothetical protein